MTDDTITDATRARAAKIAADMKAKGYVASAVEINALEAAGVDTTGIKRQGSGATSTWSPPTPADGAKIVIDVSEDPTGPDFALAPRDLRARGLRGAVPLKQRMAKNKARKAAKAARRK